MDLTSVPTIKELLAKYAISQPNKLLGQNFLINKDMLARVVDAAELTEDDTVVEVGSGLGTLTIELAKNAKKVFAVEKDRYLIPILQDVCKEYDNIEILNQDILHGAWDLGIPDWKLVGNIPYYLTSALIRKFLELPGPPSDIILMVQKEVAQRICAKPPQMSILAVSVQFYDEAKIISYVSKSCFWPMPDVDSAIIKIVRMPSADKVSPAAFFRVIKAGFSSPRKQLGNNLSAGLKIPRREADEILRATNIDPARRAETLTVDEWKKITIPKNVR